VASRLRIYVDDLASISGDARAELANEDAVLLSQLDNLEQVRSPASFGAEDTRAAIVTADARLGSIVAGARRVGEIGLAATLNDNPDAVFQYFDLSVQPDQLRTAIDALDVDAVVPVYRSAGAEYHILGIAEANTLDTLAASGLTVAAIGAPNLPDTHDLYLIRDAAFSDDVDATLAIVPEHGGQILLSLDEGLVVAVPADASIEDFHFPATTHGHNLKMLPDRALLRRQVDPAAAAGLLVEDLEPATEVAESVRELISEARVKDVVARLSGSRPVRGSPIRSRHVHHADATRAVAMLADELSKLGLQALRHRFVHEGIVRENVYADINGTGDGMIWVTAHLDSTAARGGAYQPDTDPAPGADDDGSGSAAVVAIAAALVTLAETAPPAQTIRFALFNAEEHGLVGSGYFAKAAADADLRIEAVLQLDMVGFVPAGDDRRFELHYGHLADPAVESRSEPIAKLLAAAAKLFDGIGDAEIYRSPTDPADGRSDHTSFQERGYPAILVCENFFGGPIGQPAGPPNNPNYHSANDTGIDGVYATAIARAAALSAWTLASA
jgi:bacterial leucyl aminopeptidase